ncbi:MAG: bifunctional 2-C-methyl-D-erythritol 4-phosphate cytidylyltransferase/2-C-methyl-D-erythritol 2,4-cyclodiphosphate synthase [Gemmobacter sp.]
MQTAAIIVAAGRGSRMGGEVPKQWRLLAGQPVLAHSLAAFRAAGVGRILLVLHPDDMDRAAPLLGPGVEAVAGGETRDASVRAGLLAAGGAERVLIHDGARPLLRPGLILRLIAALDDADGAAPALPVTDALWRADGGRVTGAEPRAGLYRAQTPQAFRLDAILSAHLHHKGGAADDVEVACAAGIGVAVTPGDEENLKLTWPGDFDRAERILAARAGAQNMAARTGARNDNEGGPAMDIRCGNGFDVHRFGPGDHVTLCGVAVPFGRGLAGHSDADVGMHALSDAIYGALAEGDIGSHFPPSDPQWKGAASRVFLEHAAGRARARGFAITHVDVTLICEAPKIGPHAGAMRAALAGLLGLEPGRVSVKATTSERLGFTGRGEGIAAIATATLIAP